MRVLMVNIREVWVFVVHWAVSVPMRMRLRLIHTCFVWMLVVLIVRVDMGVLKGGVGMSVLMGLAQVQPYAQAHERKSHPKRRGGSFSEKQQ